MTCFCERVEVVYM